MSAERVMVFERSCISTSLVWLSRMELSCACSQPAALMSRGAGQQTSMALAGSSTKPETVWEILLLCTWKLFRRIYSLAEQHTVRSRTARMPMTSPMCREQQCLPRKHVLHQPHQV